MKTTIITGLCLFGLLWGKRGALEVGDQAPGFRLLDQDSVYQDLSAYRGRYVVVYFYPKDGTPG